MVGDIFNVVADVIVYAIGGIMILGGLIVVGTVVVGAIAGLYSLATWVIDGIRD